MTINALLDAASAAGSTTASGMGRMPQRPTALPSRTCVSECGVARQGHATAHEEKPLRGSQRLPRITPLSREAMGSAWPATVQFLRSETLRYAEQTLMDAHARFGAPPTHHRAESAAADKRAARARRHLPIRIAETSVGASFLPLTAHSEPTPTPSADKPAISRLRPQWTAKRHYSLSEALRALSTCRSPFKHTAQLSDELHAYLQGRPETAPGNHTLEQVGAILDDISSLDSRIFLMQSVCEMARIGADVLDGEPLSASDMLAVVSVQRSITELRRTGAGSKLGKKVQRTPLRSRPRPLKQRLHAIVKTSPQYWLSDWIGRHIWPSGAREKIPRGHDEGRALANGQGGETLAASHSLTGEQDRSATIGDIAGSGGAGDSTGIVGIVETKEETEERPLPGEQHREIVLATPAHRIDSVQRASLHGAPAPARAAVALVENVPFIRRSNPEGRPEWQLTELADYRPKTPIPSPPHAEEGGVYLVDGREFIHLHAHLYPIRFASRDEPWLVDRQSQGGRHGPPLPLERVGPERWALTMPRLQHDAGAHGARAGIDGFIRIGGRRFIALSSITVEVSPPFIHNEVAIRHLAEHREEALPDIDVENIIRTPDGDHLLQGRFGFYPVTFDAAQQRMLVRTQQQVSRYALLFDLRTEEWHVCDNGVYAENAPPPPSLPLARQPSEPLAISERAADSDPTRKESLQLASRRLRSKTLLSRRPALRLFLAEAFDAMAEMRLHRGNRRDETPALLAKSDNAPVWIGEIRSAIYALLPDARRWERMTVLEKQEQAALAADLAYRSSGREPLVQQSAYCNEMAELLIAQMCTRSPALRGHMLQIGVRDLPGTGLTHVTVLYADDPGYFAIFGALTEPGITAADLPVMSKSALSNYLWHYRDVLVVLDPWGDTKVLEPDTFVTQDALAHAFDDNLRLAGFAVGANRDFRVQAVIPARR